MVSIVGIRSIDQRRRGFAHLVHQLLEVLPAQQLGRVLAEHFAQVRGADADRIDDGVAGQLGAGLVVLGDPAESADLATKKSRKTRAARP
jgi:hypothetical protein